MTKENYLHRKDHNHNDYYQLRKTFLQDDRLVKRFKQTDYAVVVLYSTLESKVSLSANGSSNEFKDAQENYFCRFSEDDARIEIQMGSSTYKERKKFLKKVGLIWFGTQEKKQQGSASNIYVTPWDEWVKKNGLYSHGEWIHEPSSKDFYNPTDIVKTQPFIQSKEEPTEIEIAAFEDLKKRGLHVAKDFQSQNRMVELNAIVTEQLGEGKKFKEATIEQVEEVRSLVNTMEQKINEGSDFDYPDF